MLVLGGLFWAYSGLILVFLCSCSGGLILCLFWIFARSGGNGAGGNGAGDNGPASGGASGGAYKQKKTTIYIIVVSFCGGSGGP